MTESKLKILLIEHNLADSQLIHRYLESSHNFSFEISHEATLLEGYTVLKKKFFDIVLIDLNLPDISGLEAFNLLQSEFENIPMIVLSGVHDEKTALLAVKNGAQDYIAKTQMNQYILTRGIKYAIERKHMELEIIRTQKAETIGLLAGGIAHDFNNILTSILGNISLIKMDMTPQSNSEHYLLLQEAENAALRAKNLANQLLTFSKGGAPIKKTMHLFKIIQNSAEFALRGSNVRCILDIDPSLWQASVDQGQIQQVLNNVIINAYQAMPHGGEILIQAMNINIEPKDNISIIPGNYVKITVQDEGIGISPENMQKIYDPYYSTKPDGSGLGLTTSFSIIKQHDGYIHVESELNIGTSFQILLPAITSRQNDALRGSDMKSIERKPLVLIMDDEAGVRNILKRMLEKLDLKVIETKNGMELIEKYKEQLNLGTKVDLVIMDLTIPGGMGGKKAMEILIEKYPTIQAIVSSGYSNDPIMANYQDYGFLGILKKPFTIKELRAIIQNHITN